MLAALERALAAVPMLSSFGIRPEDLRGGAAVLRLPYTSAVANHAGGIHNAAIFAVGELSAAVAVATHPDLARLAHFQRSSRIKYFAMAQRDVTAHAHVPVESARGVREAVWAGPVVLDVPVKVLDGHGSDVAELVCRFVVRSG